MLALLSSSAAYNVAVTGATGRTGRLVVDSLLKSGHSVTALVRDGDKAASVLPAAVACRELDLATAGAEEMRTACAGADKLIWCATGFTDAGELIDVRGMKELVPGAIAATGETPAVVMLSSAGVTRPAWDDAKKELRAWRRRQTPARISTPPTLRVGAAHRLLRHPHHPPEPGRHPRQEVRGGAGGPCQPRASEPPLPPSPHHHHPPPSPPAPPHAHTHQPGAPRRRRCARAACPTAWCGRPASSSKAGRKAVPSSRRAMSPSAGAARERCRKPLNFTCVLQHTVSSRPSCGPSYQLAGTEHAAVWRVLCDPCARETRGRRRQLLCCRVL